MKTPVCLLCGRRYATAQSRDTHAATAHPGIPREAWRGVAQDHPGVEFLPAMPGRKTQPRALPVATSDQVLPRRTLPPKEECDQADGLDALPWVKYPRNEVEASNVAALLGKLASTIAANSREHEIILSYRDYFLAMGARLAKQKAVA
ncbi:MAG TPA: hypothetical protein VFN49_03685 [Candidatus Aquilonibacter sp.]|nr:hypothetical protein [Candidatus Aquilonibacter sp.]